METEFEAKFYPVDKAQIRKKLKALEAKLVTPERKMRRVIFDSQENPTIQGTYLRIRDEGNCIRMSVKVHAKKGGQVKDQKETEVKVEDYQKAIAVIKAAGLIETNYCETLRESWNYQGAEVEIDTWPGLKTYIEIEAKSEKEVKRIAEKLGFDWNQKIITGVLQIYMKVYNLGEREAWEKTRHLTFEKNLFKQNA